MSPKSYCTTNALQILITEFASNQHKRSMNRLSVIEKHMFFASVFVSIIKNSQFFNIFVYIFATDQRKLGSNARLMIGRFPAFFNW